MLPARRASADPEVMARQPRFDLPDISQHIVQRGNNRLPCFLDDDDRQRYLALLREALIDTGCRLHAYVLMDNHVHLKNGVRDNLSEERCQGQFIRTARLQC